MASRSPYTFLVVWGPLCGIRGLWELGYLDEEHEMVGGGDADEQQRGVLLGTRMRRLEGRMSILEGNLEHLRGSGLLARCWQRGI